MALTGCNGNVWLLLLCLSSCSKAVNFEMRTRGRVLATDQLGETTAVSRLLCPLELEPEFRIVCGDKVVTKEECDRISCCWDELNDPHCYTAPDVFKVCCERPLPEYGPSYGRWRHCVPLRECLRMRYEIHPFAACEVVGEPLRCGNQGIGRDEAYLWRIPKAQRFDNPESLPGWRPAYSASNPKPQVVGVPWTWINYRRPPIPLRVMGLGNVPTHPGAAGYGDVYYGVDGSIRAGGWQAETGIIPYAEDFTYGNDIYVGHRGTTPRLDGGPYHKPEGLRGMFPTQTAPTLPSRVIPGSTLGTTDQMTQPAVPIPAEAGSAWAAE